MLRVREDGRCVVLVRRSDGKTCVLKTSFAALNSAAGLANRELARLVAKSAAPIFPAIYDANPEYTLEAFIEGRKLRVWLNEAFEAAPLHTFFSELRIWSEGQSFWDGAANLSPQEIQAIVESYITKCTNHSRYSGKPDALRALTSIARDRELKDKVRWISKTAEQITIPRGMMCGDMGNVNLVVQNGSNRIFAIDYEFLGPGHRGFDCAYLLSALAKLHVDAEALTTIRDLTLTEDYLGSKELAEFFTLYADVLTTIGKRIFGERAH